MTENINDDLEINSIIHRTDWTDKLEETAKLIGQECRGYKTMHIESSIRNDSYNKILMLIGIVLGPISGTLTGAQALIGSINPYISTTATAFGYITGIIVAIAKYGDFGQLSSSSKRAAAKYTSLEGNIRRQMSLQRCDRVSSMQYLQWIESKFDDLFLSTPIIPIDIYNNYEKNAISKGIVVPGKYKETIIINKILTPSENMQRIDLQKSPDQKDIKTIYEINKYSDKMLAYEMDRFVRHK